MSVYNFEELCHHVGHKIVCVLYGLKDKKTGKCKNPANVAVECETCNEVLMSFDK